MSLRPLRISAVLCIYKCILNAEAAEKNEDENVVSVYLL
jgi:hypothetical protein